MSSNKRRKLDVGQAPQMLSAAALRRRLLESQASLTTAATPEDHETGAAGNGSMERSAAESRRKPGVKSPVKSPVKREVSRAPETVLLGQFEDQAEDDALETSEPVDDPPKQTVVQLSSFKPSKSNFQQKADGTAVLRLTDGERLVILGSYGIKLRSGEATISGATLYASGRVHWVHAPYCHALPVIRCLEQAVVEIRPHPGAPELRSLERLSPLFGNLWNEVSSAEGVPKQTYQILSTSADGPKKAVLQALRSPAEWNKTVAALVSATHNKPPVVVICGPKSSGKSTLSRILTNRLMTDHGGTKKLTWPGVAVLDIDPGQPEFSPPGVISLVQLNTSNLSPPFCHPTGDEYVVKSHAVASVTPGYNLEHYWKCVLDLFTHYAKPCTKCPLIINTPGWIQGSGLVLLTDLISNIRPTEVIYMSENGPGDTVEELKSACKDVPFTALPSQSSEYTSRTALHLRHMQAMSYFHTDPDRITDAEIRWKSTPLTLTPPILMKYSGANSGIIGIICYGYQPEPYLLAETINGSILAVVEIEDPKALRNSSQNDDDARETEQGLEDLIQRTPESIPYIHRNTPIEPERSRCLGLALVRGIDAQRNVLALSTPLSPDRLNGKMIVMVSGKFDPPTWAYTEDHYYRASQNGRSNNDEDVEERDMPHEVEMGRSRGSEAIPWAERLHGSQKRAVGSKVWRVRRDLGRNRGAAG